MVGAGYSAFMVAISRSTSAVVAALNALAHAEGSPRMKQIAADLGIKYAALMVTRRGHEIFFRYRG